MRHVLAPIREEPEDREGEAEWITAAAETVINPVSFKQFNQSVEKRLIKWYSREGVGIIVGRDRATQGAQNRIRSYVRVAERKSSPRFQHRMAKNYCVPSVSANRDIIRVISNFTLKNKGRKMNKKGYVANLPFRAGVPELNAIFSTAGSVTSVKIVADSQTGKLRGIAFVRGDVHTTGSPESCFQAEPDRFHGVKFAG